MQYTDFLKTKIARAPEYGTPVKASDLHPSLLPHQADIVRWAVHGGRRAIFAAFGLGKSRIQVETLRLTLKAHGSGRGLIICPLGVRQEFKAEAEALGQTVRFVRRSEQVGGDGLYVTNYESVRDGKLDPDLFTAVSLDEASVLRSFGSKTYQTFLTLFENVKYRFVATATPSPNKYKELIHYAGFLGVMDTGQALTRFFQRDSTKANNLTLYPHKEKEFWLWLNSWAVFVQKPSDLGYSDKGYDLPPLNISWDEVATDMSDNKPDRDGQAALFRGGNSSLVDVARNKRDSLPDRIGKLEALLAEHYPTVNDQVIIWCDLNAEQRAIETSLKQLGISYSSIYGDLDIDETEARLAAWKNRETVALIGKPIMLGQGLNLQQCNRSIFIGATFKFNDTIQAVHRIHRFGQTRPCHVHIIYASSETGVVDVLKEKWVRHEELTSKMSEIIKKYGLSRQAIANVLTRSLGVERVEVSGDGWTAVNNDCVEETTAMEENSVDLIVTSIPFSNQYEYTPSYNDFGHTDDNQQFWSQMDYLTPQLLRILKPGRIYACHVKDRILFGNVTHKGVPTVSPFHAEAIFHAQKHGFDFMGMITIVTDVVRENNQTYRLGWTEQCKDGTKMGVGMPEYVLLFHKPQTDRTRGYADEPVVKDKTGYSRARWQVDAHAFWRDGGNRLLTPEELIAMPVEQRSRLFTEQTLKQVYDFESHIRIGEELDAKGALPATFMSLAPASWHPEVWTDINRMLTLNTQQSQRRQQLHVCPLQFETVDRLITRFSNPGDLVFDPFGGIMTVPYRALHLDRRGRGVELNPGYWADGVKYLEAEERKKAMPTLFDLVDAKGDTSCAA